MRYFFLSLISLFVLGSMAVSCSRPDVEVLASAGSGQSLQAGSEAGADWFAIVGQFHNDGLAAFADSSFAGLSPANFAALSATKAVGEYAAFWNAEGGGQLPGSVSDSLRLVYASRPVVPGLAESLAAVQLAGAHAFTLSVLNEVTAAMPATFELNKVNTWVALAQAKAQAVRQHTTLSTKEKNALLAVLGVAVYSANHWKEVLQDEENVWHQGLSTRTEDLETILGPIWTADVGGAISGLGRAITYTPASTAFGPHGVIVNYVGNVGVGAMISSGGAAIAAWLNL